MKFQMNLPKMEGVKKQANDQAKEVLWRAMVKMESIAKDKAPVDTGNLKARIHIDPKEPGATEYILSDGVDYGIHVEYGTKPHYVPITPLMGWAGRVLGDKKAAYAVRAKISKEGTPAQPFFRPAQHEVHYKWLPLIKKNVLGSNS